MKIRQALLLLFLIPAAPQLSPAGSVEAGKAPPASASTAAPLSAAALLDQAIWWPGDFGQICRSAQRIWIFESPPLPAYGTASRQEYFLSKSRIGELNQQRAAIAEELLKRLKAFDWKHFPPAPIPTPEIRGFAKSERARLPADGPYPRPWKPENSLALGAAMLRIIEATEAVETLPELLRLEEELNSLNEAALKARDKNAGYSSDPLGPVPDLYVPPVETADPLVDFESTADDKKRYVADAGGYAADAKPKPPEAKLAEDWTAWESRLFRNLVFQREILGVSLELLERKDYAPLRQSLLGRLTALTRRLEGLNDLKETGTGDSPESAGVPQPKPDADSPQPLVHSVVLLPFDKTTRQEARQLIQAFVSGGTVPTSPDGTTILEEAIAEPGDFNQMCSIGPGLSFPLPLPASVSLVNRHYNLSDKTISRLQACRDLVMPALSDRLKSMKLEPPAPKPQDPAEAHSYRRSGQDSRSFGPLVLQAVLCLNAVECLPDLLRMEQQLTDLIAKAESDPAFAPPSLPVDSPAVWAAWDSSDESPEENKKRDRAIALLSCQIYQRELLGLIRIILQREDCVALKSSAFAKAQLEQGRKALREAAEKVDSKDAIPWYLSKKITWDPQKRKAVIAEGDSIPVDLPYTPAARMEIRTLAAAYLKDTPPDKRKAGDGMVLPWPLPQP